MADLRELYQELILEHCKAPRNYKLPVDANHKAEGYNPLCGDHYTVSIRMDGDSIGDIGFEGSGCAISKASASLMTQAVKGKTKAEAIELFERFHKLVTSSRDTVNGANREELGKLAVFGGVVDFPTRVKCASLAWHTMRTALEGTQDSITTE